MTETITHWRCAACGQAGRIATADGHEVAIEAALAHQAKHAACANYHGSKEIHFVALDDFEEVLHEFRQAVLAIRAKDAAERRAQFRALAVEYASRFDRATEWPVRKDFVTLR